MVDPKSQMGQKTINGYSARVEIRPPRQGVPGMLKPSGYFNDMIGIDGFEGSNDHGKAYVLHSVNECTRFHLGRGTVRDSSMHS